MTAIRAIHEIEFTSRCNLACVYCPHPTLKRPKADMTEYTFERTVDQISYLILQGTQDEVSMTGLGETLLHPQFVPWMHYLRKVMGPRRRLVISTNGLLVTQEIAREFKAADVTVYVSLHRPEVAKLAIDLIKKAGCTWGENHAFVDSAIDWAGQVKWGVSAKRRTCEYLRSGWAAVRQDGAVTTCCMDAEALHPIGHVNDALGSLTTAPTPLCSACHMVPP